MFTTTAAKLLDILNFHIAYVIAYVSFSYLIRKSSKKNYKNIFALLFLIIY
jgi:hypothetical protein